MVCFVTVLLCYVVLWNKSWFKPLDSGFKIGIEFVDWRCFSNVRLMIFNLGILFPFHDLDSWANCFVILSNIVPIKVLAVVHVSFFNILPSLPAIAKSFIYNRPTWWLIIMLPFTWITILLYNAFPIFTRFVKSEFYGMNNRADQILSLVHLGFEIWFKV